MAQSKTFSPAAVISSAGRTGDKVREMADSLGREWFWMEKDEDESRFHADGEEPFYEYTDEETGELLLTLYYDEETKQGRGISYGYGAGNKMGFVFDRYEKAEWEEPNLLTWDGSPPESSHPQLENVEEERDCHRDGKLIHYEYTGDVTEWYDSYSGIMPRITFQIEYSYRDDGTLREKFGHFDGREYRLPSGDKDSYFDELGREIFSAEYVTHGSLQKYYLYEGDSMKPTYCLVLDSGWEVYMVEYADHS